MAVIHLASGPSPLWYLARGTGAICLVLLSITVLLGITGAVRFQPRARVPRFLVDGLHRNTSLLVVVLLVVHILMSVLDPFAHIKVLDAVIPFASAYRPLWLGFGALAFDLLIALIVTSLLRRRLGLRMWRGVHWSAYACWPVAVLHGIGTGSDARVAWFELLTLACVLSVAAAIAMRLRRDWPLSAGRRLGGGVVAVVSLAAFVVFALQGPLQPGWAARAGTPVTLLASVRSPRVASAARATARIHLPMAATLNGTLQRSTRADGSGQVDIRATVHSSPSPARVSVQLVGQRIASGGLRVTGSSITFGSVAAPRLYAGTRVAVSGSDLVATLRPARGSAITLRLILRVPPGSGSVTGRASAMRA
jgi:methionine sulfoxide reductase heme-binding subunit